MLCKMRSNIFFLILFLWLGAILVFSLLLNTSGVKESFFPSQYSMQYNQLEIDNMPNVPSGSLSILAENKVSPECCPSAYTTSNGCVCLTNDQLESIKTRGGNRIASN
jgi:hypothetical protein